MHIYALRHGESEYNILGLCNHEPPRQVNLTETGRRQAEMASKRLRGVPIDILFCSELPRARQTAEILSRQHGASIEPRAELNDIRTGCDGEPVTDYFRRIAHDRLNARIGDGETLLEHKQRILGFIDWLKSQRGYRNCLLVAHEETLRVFKAYAERLSDEAMLALHFENCEIFEFDI
jgi:alpha-ribazole phosphatase